MAAGGFKEFVAGETLDQEEINDFLMQGVLVFAGTAARGSAITSPVEGQFSFRTDDDLLEFYDGSEWVALAGGSPIATGGDEVQTVGSFKYHIFTNSGTFTVTKEGLCEILVVGAGGGGAFIIGGGGAGGSIEPASAFWKQTLPPASYTVTIASGGAGATSIGFGGTPSATSFAGINTVSARGGGGGASSAIGAQGGSGGGSGGGSSFIGGFNNGSNTFRGGAGPSDALNTRGAGGGGGASADGDPGIRSNTVPAGGDGGEGLALTSFDSNLTSGNFTSFSGMTVISSGGGGGVWGATPGVGGTGAGNGSSSGVGGSATSFGSGGGGGAFNGSSGFAGGAGYAGLVIVRYEV